MKQLGHIFLLHLLPSSAGPHTVLECHSSFSLLLSWILCSCQFDLEKNFNLNFKNVSTFHCRLFLFSSSSYAAKLNKFALIFLPRSLCCWSWNENFLLPSANYRAKYYIIYMWKVAEKARREKMKSSPHTKQAVADFEEWKVSVSSAWFCAGEREETGNV